MLPRRLNDFNKVTAVVFLLFLLANNGTYAFPIVSGPYLGAGLGSSWLTFKATRDMSFINLPIANPPLINFGSKTKNFTNPSLSVGYQTNYHQLYLAGEWNANLENQSMSLTKRLLWPEIPNAFNAQVKVYHPMSLDILIGPSFANGSIIYFRGGLAYAKAKFRFKQFAANDVTRMVTEPKVTHNLWGGDFGVGVAQQLSKHLMARLDYKYSVFRKLTQNDKVTPVSNSHKQFRVNTQQLILSLNYII